MIHVIFNILILITTSDLLTLNGMPMINSNLHNVNECTELKNDVCLIKHSQGKWKQNLDIT